MFRLSCPRLVFWICRERVWSSLTKLYPCPLHASSSGQEQEEPAASAADGYIITSPDGRYRTFECLLATIIFGISISRRPVLTNPWCVFHPLLNRFMVLWVLGVDSAGSMTNYHFYGYSCTKNRFVIFWNPTTWSPVFWTMEKTCHCYILCLGWPPVRKNSMEIVPKVRQSFFVCKESFRCKDVPCGGTEHSASLPWASKIARFESDPPPATLH